MQNVHNQDWQTGAIPWPNGLEIPTDELLQSLDERAYTFRALTQARQRALRIPQESLDRHRYVIFSDSHRSDRTPGSDDFLPNEETYCEALRYYLDGDYRLALNGDVEEGWKADYDTILESYAHSAYALERQFAARGEGHYLRTYGNHDVDWANPAIVNRHLSHFFDRPVRVHSGIMLGDRVFITHGHQGDLCSDRMIWISRRVIRHLWKPVQSFLHLSMARAATNSRVRSKRDRTLSAWARANRLLVIAGHTHRPLLAPNPDSEPEPSPHYMNDGCCVHRDGITGLEIDRGTIRLVQWHRPTRSEGVRRSVLQHTGLAGMLAAL
ncbi:MAG: hypothetical protein JXQ72_06950 [Anaerolineae bacterium]|nr:hypothetical protein [Anaerolineae bacterium]